MDESSKFLLNECIAFVDTAQRMLHRSLETKNLTSLYDAREQVW